MFSDFVWDGIGTMTSTNDEKSALTFSCSLFEINAEIMASGSPIAVNVELRYTSMWETIGKDCQYYYYILLYVIIKNQPITFCYILLHTTTLLELHYEKWLLPFHSSIFVYTVVWEKITVGYLCVKIVCGKLFLSLGVSNEIFLTTKYFKVKLFVPLLTNLMHNYT